VDKRIFEISMEFSKLYNYYMDKAESTNSNSFKEEYKKIADKCAEFHDRLLEIGWYLNDEKYIGKITRTLKDYENLKKYTQITVIYNYDNGFSLVEDTASNFHLIPTAIVE
jgi:hypothetical protein